MKYIHSNSAPQAIGPYSQAIEVNNMVYTSGQIPLKANGQMIEGGIKEQTKQVLDNLKNVLKEANSSLNKVIKTTIFITDMDNFTALNEVYSSYFSSHKPSRSTVAVKKLPKNALIEIECIALK